MVSSVEATTSGMSTAIADALQESCSRTGFELSRVKDNISRLNSYVEELCANISDYSRLGYNGAGGGDYANVCTEDVEAYLHAVASLSQATTSFHNAASAIANDTSSELSEKLRELKRADESCRNATYSLSVKIRNRELQLAETQRKIKSLKEDLHRANLLFTEALKKRGEALDRANAVAIPPIVTREIKDQSGKVIRYERDITAFEGAKLRREAFLREAELYAEKIPGLNRKASAIEQELKKAQLLATNIERSLEELRDVSDQLDDTKKEILDAISELSACESDLQGAINDIEASCDNIKRSADRVEETVGLALKKLYAYAAASTPSPRRS